MAKKLFAVDTEEVKHEAQTETQHPLFSPLIEQWEEATANIQDLRPRTALIKRRGHRVIRVSTPLIAPYAADRERVNALMRELAHLHGVPASQVGGNGVFSEQPRPPIQLMDWEPVAKPIVGERHKTIERGGSGVIFNSTDD